MLSSSLIQRSGLAALVGGVLHALGDVYDWTHLIKPLPEQIGSTPFFVQYTVYLLSLALMLLGLVGLYAFQSERTGPFGLMSFFLAFLGTVLYAAAVWALLFIGPLIATEAPQLLRGQAPASVASRLAIMGFLGSYGTFALGWLLFGVATLRNRLLPRLAALLLIIGAVLSSPVVPFPPRTDLVFSVAVAWLGLALLTSRGGRVQQSARVS